MISLLDLTILKMPSDMILCIADLQDAASKKLPKPVRGKSSLVKSHQYDVHERLQDSRASARLLITNLKLVLHRVLQLGL